MKTKAIKICLAVAEAGGTPYITGGVVRDMLMDRPASDVDIEVFGIDRATLEQILFNVCERVDYVGAQYGIYKADGIDVGFPRRDKGHGKGAEVEVDSMMSVEEASKRRDLTFNALYFNPFTLEIIDPFNGKFYIKNKVVRHTSASTFHEDPLRPLRAARFAATLGFDIDHTTIGLCRCADRDKILGLPKDRVFGELKKVLMEAPKPSVFFEALESMHLLDAVFPELHATKKIEQGAKYHPEGSVYSHTLMALDVLLPEERTLEVMVALLLHDFGKISVEAVDRGDGKISFHGHAEATSLAKTALKRLTDEIELSENVMRLVEFHMTPYNFIKGGVPSVAKKQVRKLAAKIDLPKLMLVNKADRLGRGKEAAVKYEAVNMGVASEILRVYEEIKGEIAPLVQGRDLITAGYAPGKHFGEMLKRVYEAQLEEEFCTVEDGVKFAKELLKDKE